MEEPIRYVASTIDACDTLGQAEYVNVPRHELEQEHTHLLGRLQQLRRLLGYTPLPTGKQLRREANTAANKISAIGASP